MRNLELIPKLIAKDAARSLRFVLSQGKKDVLGPFSECLPEPIRPISRDLLRAGEIIISSVDGFAHDLSGSQYSKANFRTPFIASRSPIKSERAIYEGAANLYIALTCATKKLKANDIWVSEWSCFEVISEFYDNHQNLNDTSSAEKCLFVFNGILDKRTISALTMTKHTRENDHTDVKRLVVFAVSLWAFVQRDNYETSEIEVLQMCCDLVKQKEEEIIQCQTRLELLSYFEDFIDVI